MNVTVKRRGNLRHVWIGETSASEPLMKHRKRLDDVETGVSKGSAISVAATYLLAMRRPVYRWRDSNLGSGMELGNSSGNAKRKPYKCEPRRGKVSMYLKGADHPVVVMKLL